MKRSDKKPLGRPPAGAVLIDGKWQPTQESTEIAKRRLLRHRELNRARRERARELLRKECPDLFAPPTPEVVHSPARSLEEQSTLWVYQKKD